MRGAHAAINRLAEFGWVACGVAKSEVLPALAHELAAMNVELRRRISAVEAALDAVEMRAQHGLSQREYADMLGIDVRTLQNWEQGRNRPDPAAVSLMRIFAHAP